MSEYDGFRVERDDERGVATITLDVPGKLNRVSMAARDQLARRLRGARARTTPSAFVVLTGAGETFTAGGDIAGLPDSARRGTSRGSPTTSPRPSAARSR